MDYQPSSTRRRGHQHHPRYMTRRRLDQPQQLIANSNNNSNNNNDDDQLNVSSSPDGGPTRCGPVKDQPITRSPSKISKTPLTSELKQTTVRNLQNKQKFLLNARPAQCGLGGKVDNDEIVERKLLDLGDTEEHLDFEHADARDPGDGNSDEELVVNEEDPEMLELIKLRCPSERAEVQAEREARKRKRCADYPGLAFGCSIFSSDTMMKFNLIRNELKNLSNNQLKRAGIFLSVT